MTLRTERLDLWMKTNVFSCFPCWGSSHTGCSSWAPYLEWRGERNQFVKRSTLQRYKLAEVILTRSLQKRYWHQPYFTDEETEVSGGFILPNTMQLIRGRVRIRTMLEFQSPLSFKWLYLTLRVYLKREKGKWKVSGDQVLEKQSVFLRVTHGLWNKQIFPLNNCFKTIALRGFLEGVMRLAPTAENCP